MQAISLIGDNPGVIEKQSRAQVRALGARSGDDPRLAALRDVPAQG